MTQYPHLGRPRLLGVHKGPVTCIRATADLVVSASVDKSVVVWHHQKAPSSFKVHFKPVRACDFAGDRFVLSASDDKLVKVSSLLNKSVSSYVGHTHWVRSAAFSPDATSIVSGSDDRTVRVWDVDTRQQVRMWCQHTDTVRCVRFNSKANVVVTCSEDSTINIWDVRAEVLRQHYNQAHGHSPIVHVALHPTRDLVLSASADSTLRLWDLRAGRLQYTVHGHQGPVHACEWVDTGEQFVSCDDRSLHVWSSGSSQQVNVGQQACVGSAESNVVPRAPSFNKNSQLDALHTGGQRAADVRDPAALHAQLCEELARPLEHMVSQMGTLTQSLQNIDSRLSTTEATVAEMATILAARRGTNHSANLNRSPDGEVHMKTLAQGFSPSPSRHQDFQGRSQFTAAEDMFLHRDAPQ